MPTPANTGPLRIGDVFLGKYHILELMGRGGFGCVYRARSEFIGREVAIKVIDKQGSGQALSRGQQEAVILGKLKHPNIVEVYDADITPDGKLYIIMELLRGKTLSDKLRHEGPFEIAEGLHVLEGLCAAFQDAHKQGVFHRDIKPANIFLCEDGEPKVLDFGIAKMVGSIGVRTAPNMVVGTSLYVSPEQLHAQSAGLGHKPAPELSDVYALGLVAFQMFHGQHPLMVKEPNADFRNPQVVWRLHVKTQAPVLEEEIPGFPTAVSQLVRTAVAKDPAYRLPSMAEFGKKAQIARLQHSADESEAVYHPIPQRESPLRPSKPHVTVEPEAVATRPLEKRGTQRLFEGIPKATIEDAPSSHKAPHSDRPVRASTPSTRRETPRGTVRRDSMPVAETPEPASRTITVKTLPVRQNSEPKRKATVWMAAAGLAVGMAGMLWLDPLGARAPVDDEDFIIDQTIPLERPISESAPERTVVEEPEKAPDPGTESPEPPPETAEPQKAEATPQTAPKPKPAPAVAKTTPVRKPAPTKAKAKKPAEKDPELPASGLWDGEEPWLE